MLAVPAWYHSWIRMAMVNAPSARVLVLHRQWLAEEQCMNCSFMSRDLKLAKLVEVVGQRPETQIPPSGVF